jgi:putative aldouronate transport system substrate-binding protein
MKTKKVLALIMTSIIASSIFVGCKKTEAPSVDNKQQEKLSGFLASKDPISMTIHMHYWDRMVFDDNWEVFKKAAELTNVTLKGTAAKTSANSKEAFNLMLASGSIPDIIHYASKNDMDKAGMDGALIPLNDLIDKYAPDLKKFYEQHPEVKKAATAPDGKIYYLPNKPGGKAGKAWFIRKDWLDKLNLQEPKTVDEYYNVLKAFKENDPNGNGKQDEIGFTQRDKVGGVYDLLILWGARRGDHIDNGKYKFGVLEPEFKEAISNIAKWYKEGLIDKEIFTRGNNARNMLMDNNTLGSTHDWLASTAKLNLDYKDKVPGVNFVAIAPPKNSKGKIVAEHMRPAVNQTGWGITSANKNPEVAMRYLNFWYTEEGRRLMNYGIEGKSYTMDNSKPKLDAEVIKGSTVDNLNKFGAQIEIGFFQDFEYEKQWMIDIALAGTELYEKGNWFAEQMPTLIYTVEEKKKLDELQPAIGTFIEEKLQKWVLGAEPVDGNYEKFIEELKKMKIDEVIKIKEAAYERYKNIK